MTDGLVWQPNAPQDKTPAPLNESMGILALRIGTLLRDLERKIKGDRHRGVADLCEQALWYLGEAGYDLHAATLVAQNGRSTNVPRPDSSLSPEELAQKKRIGDACRTLEKIKDDATASRFAGKRTACLRRLKTILDDWPTAEGSPKPVRAITLPEGEWISPTTLTDLAKRLGNCSAIEARTLLRPYGLRGAGGKHLWTVRTDAMPAGLRKKLADKARPN